LAKDPDNLAGSFNTGGLLSGFLAEEDEFDRRALWRLGSWAVGAVGAVIIAVMANQSSLSLRRDQVAVADLLRQAQQIQAVAKESQHQARQLASAIDTLNSDRDRLYSRVTTLEQGLDSVTGAIARQSTSPASSPPAPAPAGSAEPSAAQAPASAPPVGPVATTQPATPAHDKPATTDKPSTAEKPTAPEKTVAANKLPAAEKPVAAEKPLAAEKLPVVAATDPGPPPAGPDTAKTPAATPATPLVTSKSIMAPPDPAAGKLIEPNKLPSAVTASPIPEMAAAPPASDAADDGGAPKAAIQKTQFGVDIGTANSVAGLRALWRGLLKSRSNAPLLTLQPIIVIKEGTNGLGMQLRLVAGPLNDAGAAANICAVLTENHRPCETAIYDGQRLSVKAEDPQPPAAIKPAPRHRSYPKRAAAPVAVEEPKKPEPTTISSLFGRKSSQ
jgi:hypothetical protein